MVFWIFTLAEPNATIIAACIPVLRVLFRDAAKRYYGSKPPSTGGYIRQSNHNSGLFACKDLDSNRGLDAHSDQSNISGGITRTREVVVDIEGDRSFEMGDQYVSIQKQTGTYL